MTTVPPCQPAILLVSNHPGVLAAMALLLEESRFTVCGCCEQAGQALAAAAAERPGLAIIDESIAGSLRLVAGLLEIGIPSIVCTGHEDVESVQQALAVGARACLAKRDLGQVLARAINDVLQGWTLVSPHALDE